MKTKKHKQKLAQLLEEQNLLEETSPVDSGKYHSLPFFIAIMKIIIYFYFS